MQKGRKVQKKAMKAYWFASLGHTHCLLCKTKYVERGGAGLECRSDEVCVPPNDANNIQQNAILILLSGQCTVRKCQSPFSGQQQ